MHIVRGIWVVSLTAAATFAHAQSVEPGSGEATRAWLDLQTSGRQATEAERPMDGEVADRVYQRYLDSHSHPIPLQFPREQFAAEGGGS